MERDRAHVAAVELSPIKVWEGNTAPDDGQTVLTAYADPPCQGGELP
jgi:hypothetical protein